MTVEQSLCDGMCIALAAQAGHFLTSLKNQADFLTRSFLTSGPMLYLCSLCRSVLRRRTDVDIHIEFYRRNENHRESLNSISFGNIRGDRSALQLRSVALGCTCGYDMSYTSSLFKPAVFSRTTIVSSLPQKKRGPRQHLHQQAWGRPMSCGRWY